MHEVLKFSKSFLKKLNIDVVAVYHSDIVNQKLLGKLYDYYFSISKNLYQYWICSSEKLWDSSPILSQIDKSQMRIIPFCTEGQLEFKKREKFKGKILAIGRLVPYKGFEFLINAINETNYELHIIGDGPEGPKLESIAGSNVILHKRLSDEDKKELFNQCDALVVSSINRAEAYGMIIVEAFEAGMPVIASNLNSGVTFLVQHEKTGLVFETENSEELILALKRLEFDVQLYQKISINTREFFDAILSYPHFREKIKNFKE
jgi:rhamnosyl/mannosyltransferase